MNILVCIKQVPDMEARFTPNATGTWFEESGLAFRMNDYDEFAVEEAVRLKERLGGEVEVTVLSIGPDRVVETIRKAMAMGCDHGVHVRDDVATDRDPWQIATMIAGYARSRGFGLIFTGMQSLDRGSAQVGVLVAELLGLSCATTVVGFSCDGATATVERELEGGTRAVVRLRLPALLTCQLGLNTPRYPTLPNILKARKRELLVLSPGEVGVEAPLAEASGFSRHERRSTCTVLEGEAGELAGMVVDLLKERTAVLRRGGGR
ncbi:MAG: electron transfer flavoprotein subunit beta/FixA family protein [Chlorobiaceae bacterium]|nr:electron transfer flavoprotein subunit beta/FixA family protein [Chlorobiaceae bacterium]